MPNLCSALLAGVLGLPAPYVPASFEFTARVPLRRTIVTQPLEDACAIAYAQIPLARRMPFGEVRDEVIAPTARRFYEHYVLDFVGWPSLATFTSTFIAEKHHGDPGRAYVRAQTILRREDQAALRNLLKLLEAGDGEPNFRSYGRCLRVELIQRLRQLPDQSYYSLTPAMLIQDLEPDGDPW